MDNIEIIRIELSGSHYQPDGCTKAVVTGIWWDKARNRPTLCLAYENGKSDFIPLSELGSSHILGNVTILNNT